MVRRSSCESWTRDLRAILTGWMDSHETLYDLRLT